MRRVLKNTIGISVSFIVLVVTSGCMTTKVVGESCSYYDYREEPSCSDKTEEEMDWGNTVLLGGGIVAGIVVLVLLNNSAVEKAKERRADRQRMLDRMTEEERKEYLEEEAKRVREHNRREAETSRVIEDSIRRGIEELEETNRNLQEQQRQR